MTSRLVKLPHIPIRNLAARRAARILSCVLFAAFALLAARPAGTSLKTATVHFKSGSETIAGYLALPGAPGPHPAVLVIHEWWGLNDWVKNQTQKFADAGYVALAVDLYRGDVPATIEEAHEVSRGVPDDRALRDLEAGFAFLAARADVHKTKIGVVGWCMGGGYALAVAVNNPKWAACVVNYGSLPTERNSIAKIRAPVLGNFGGDDRGIRPPAVRAFETAMRSAGKFVDMKIYEGAGHAFENETDRSAYRPAAAADAWNRTLAFLARNLK